MGDDGEGVNFNPETGELAEPFDAERSPTWRIDSLGALDWALAKLAAIEREQEQNNALADAAFERVRRWLHAQNARLDSGAAFFRGHIAAYANENKADLLGDGKKKSRELPNGKVAWRKVGGGFRVVDEAKLLAWALEHPQRDSFVRRDPAVNVAAVREWASAVLTVDTPPGMERVPEEDRLTITATGNELTKKGNNHE